MLARQHPWVLVLHFEQMAGLNLQPPCHNLILFTPLSIGDDGNIGNPVVDVSREMQAIDKRVFRTGQLHPMVNGECVSGRSSGTKRGRLLHGTRNHCTNLDGYICSHGF
jgi:hypothetical protein